MSGFDFSQFTQGGPMMFVLLALGVLGLVLFIERTLYLHRGQIHAKAFRGPCARAAGLLRSSVGKPRTAAQLRRLVRATNYLSAVSK